MEPSIIDELKVELCHALYASRREESYITLSELAELLVQQLGQESELLAEYICATYDENRASAEVGAF